MCDELHDLVVVLYGLRWVERGLYFSMASGRKVSSRGRKLEVFVAARAGKKRARTWEGGWGGGGKGMDPARLWPVRDLNVVGKPRAGVSGRKQHPPFRDALMCVYISRQVEISQRGNPSLQYATETTYKVQKKKGPDPLPMPCPAHNAMTIDCVAALPTHVLLHVRWYLARKNLACPDDTAGPSVRGRAPYN